jgi:hypothetical protein
LEIQTQTPLDIKGGIKCLREVNIPCNIFIVVGKMFVGENVGQKNQKTKNKQNKTKKKKKNAQRVL